MAFKRMVRRLVANGMFAVALASCAVTAPPQPPPAPVAEVEPPPAPPHPAKKPPAPAIASLSQAASAPADAIPADDFDKLRGLDPDQTVALLGAPQQRSDAPPAQVWHYQARACALDVYFYQDLDSRTMRVLHYEVRTSDGSDRSRPGCFGELVAARGAQGAGGADRTR